MTARHLSLEAVTYNDFELKEGEREQEYISCLIKASITQFENMIAKRRMKLASKPYATVQPNLFNPKLVSVTVRALADKSTKRKRGSKTKPNPA